MIAPAVSRRRWRAEAEQRHQREVQHGADRGAQRRSVGERQGLVAVGAGEPVAGRMARPATSEPSTPSTPATSATVATAAALASRTSRRDGLAARVEPIVPVPYSLLIASTPSTTTAACPNQMPVRLSWVVSSKHSDGVGHCEVSTAARAPALPATVKATAAASNHGELGTVRSLVHSAWTARRRRRRPAASRVPAEQQCRDAEGDRGTQPGRRSPPGGRWRCRSARWSAARRTRRPG